MDPVAGLTIELPDDPRLLSPLHRRIREDSRPILLGVPQEHCDDAPEGWLLEDI